MNATQKQQQRFDIIRRQLRASAREVATYGAPKSLVFWLTKAAEERNDNRLVAARRARGAAHEELEKTLSMTYSVSLRQAARAADNMVAALGY